MDEEAKKVDVDAYLAKIRRTIEQSNELVAQAELRVAETDRMLASQGLTREQVMAMHFSEEQLEAANAELKRRGMQPLEWLDGGRPAPVQDDRMFDEQLVPSPDDPVGGDEIEHRQRKFGMMMKPFQI